MAKCDICDQEMLTAKGCNHHIYVLNDGTEVEPIRAGEANDWLAGENDRHCGDCGVTNGETHHVGCDTERCRLCGGQFISCDCDYSDKIIIKKDKK